MHRSHSSEPDRICHDRQTRLPGDLRDVEPPDPIPNSAVKRVIADGSVGSPHARVGHRQAPHPQALDLTGPGPFFCAGEHAMCTQPQHAFVGVVGSSKIAT